MKRAFALILVFVLCLSLCACSQKETTVKLDPKNPVLLTVWTYYGGRQQQTFEELVNTFNATVGAQTGICVETHSKGSVTELSDAVMAAARRDVGAEALPEIFASYADTAYEVEQMGLLADLSAYLTKDELAEYITSYIEEGYLAGGDALRLFPIAKSTEMFLLNETAWAEFAAETGADKAGLSTWEGIVQLAKAYYEWTDAKTPDVEGDGQTFFGRDAFANYMLVGSRQLGKELFLAENGKVTLQLDKDVLRRLWDNYYVPYVNGWYGAFGRFRSDDIKTGKIVALVGSTSGALYFPDEVTDDDGNSTPIECGVYTLPNFEDTEPTAVQQGAGMAVAKSTPEKETAAVIFLKWITEKQNIRIALESGYLPVRKDACEPEALKAAEEEIGADELLCRIAQVGSAITTGYHLYTTKPFEGGVAARQIVETHLPDAANAAVAERDARIAAGMSRADAIESLTDDAAFDAWYTDFCAALTAAVEEK